MESSTVNVLLSSFPGLSLPPTLSIPLPSTSTIADLTERISSYLPSSLNPTRSSLILTTTCNKLLPFDSADKLINFLPISQNDDLQSTLLPLRLGARVCGGKGGFGSQLRAAGGRMSSRRKGNQGENNGSNRNLDGRRLRTVNEAKALAEYLALKPEMDKKEKDVRRKRWEMVVEAAEKREAEIRSGEGKRGKVDGAWMEDKEEAGEKAREAVLRAMRDGAWKDNLVGGLVGGSSTSASDSNGSSASSPPSDDSDMEDVEDVTTPAEASANVKAKPAPVRRYFGFDDDEDDDDLMSDEEDEVEEEDTNDVKGKGKAKA